MDAEFISPEDNPLHPAQHPLHNSVVLTTLFSKLCPIYDLPNCRLVSKLWYDTSLNTFRSTRTLHLDQMKWFCKSPIATDPEFGTAHRHPLKQFQNFVEDPSTECDKTPFRKLRLSHWHFQLKPDGTFHDPHLERFCWGSTVGAKITTLRLSHCYFSEANEFQLIIYKFCPLLQSLTLDNCGSKFSSEKPWKGIKTYGEPQYGAHLSLKSVKIYNFTGLFPVSWIELFSHFPSLISVSISIFAREDLSDVIEAIKVVKMQDGSKLPITELDLTPCNILISGESDSLHICGILTEFNIPIKSARFTLDDTITREYVQDIIERHAHSLTSIEVFSYLRDSWAFPLGVLLNKLEKISIFSTNDPFTDMEFLKYTPSLISMSLLANRIVMVHNLVDDIRNNMISNTLDTEEMAYLQLPKLTELKLDFKVGEADLRRLAKWLPNVLTLEMRLNDVQFLIVCQNWPKLTSLVVQGSELTDAGIVGNQDVGAADIEALSNVTCLEELTCFKAKDCHRITDESVVNGFLKMRKLNRLQLPIISNRSKRALTRKGVKLDPVDVHG